MYSMQVAMEVTLEVVMLVNPRADVQDPVRPKTMHLGGSGAT